MCARSQWLRTVAAVCEADREARLVKGAGVCTWFPVPTLGTSGHERATPTLLWTQRHEGHGSLCWTPSARCFEEPSVTAASGTGQGGSLFVCILFYLKHFFKSSPKAMFLWTFREREKHRRERETDRLPACAPRPHRQPEPRPVP